MLGVIRGAQRRDENAARRNTRGRQLIARRLPAIKLPVTLAHARSKPALEFGPSEAAGFEPLAHIFAHFVARCADRRPCCGDQIRRTAAEFANQRPHRDGGNASGQSAPAGMGRADDARTSVGDEQGDAISRLNRKRERRIVGHDNVGFGEIDPRRVRGTGFPNDGLGAVDLTQPNESLTVDADGVRDLVPGAGGFRCCCRPERPVPRRIQMFRNRLKRAADERRPPVGLRPLESVDRLH